MVYGVFVVSSNGDGTLVLPLGTASTTGAGIIVAPNPYSIPGTTNGQTVSLQIRGWPASYGTNWLEARLRATGGGGLFGETDVRQVTLDGPTNAGTVIWQSATGTSPNRFRPLIIGYPVDPPNNTPAIWINNVIVTEGNNGTVSATFTVTLSNPEGPPNNYPKTVDFRTQNDSALAGSDYVPTNGTVTFSAGETSHTITVLVTADVAAEPDERFNVLLINPVGAWLPSLTSIGTCTITEARVIEARVEGADVAVTFYTAAGRRYALEHSTDLETWSVVEGGAGILGVGGPMTVRDLGAVQRGARFYRTRLLAPF